MGFAFCVGILASGEFALRLGIGALQTLVFVALVFGSQATIYAIRERWAIRERRAIRQHRRIPVAKGPVFARLGIAWRAASALPRHAVGSIGS